MHIADDSDIATLIIATVKTKTIKLKESTTNKKEAHNILQVNKTIRFTKKENELVKRRAALCGLSFSQYCRKMAINGYIQAVPAIADITEMRAFKTLLMEYKTNFSRISNKMKASDPYLNEDIKITRDFIQSILEKLKI